MIAEFDDIEEFAGERFREAREASRSIQFSYELNARYSKSAGRLQESENPAFIATLPEFAMLKVATGMAAHSTVLSVDLRGSSNRAVNVGAINTYLTMHTYIPTMCELITRAEGQIVGLRGDGLFAVFGLKETDTSNSQITLEEIQESLKAALRCGKAMLEATETIINPLLERNDIEGGLSIGVGISVGNVVVTRIGLRDATEVTLYGSPVNQACKLCGKTYGVALHRQAWQCYPVGKGGRIKFVSLDQGAGHEARFPSDYWMLKKRHTGRKAR